MMYNGQSQWPRACWGWEFESCRKHGCLSFVSDVSCQVEVSASNPSPVQRIPIECDVSECDYEASIMRRLCPNMG
jgi:hypothetical protein